MDRDTTQRRPGRPRSTREGSVPVRVSIEMRRALRVISADLDLPSIDVTVEVLLRAWESIPHRRQQAIADKVARAARASADVGVSA